MTTLPQLSAAEKKKLEYLPVIICKRSEIWAYLGFKHINGPQAWESYPKANYVAWVHNEVGVALDEIARRIGDKHDTVARLYDALMVLNQAEDNGLFDRDDRYKKHFSFSHLTPALAIWVSKSFWDCRRATRRLESVGRLRRAISPNWASFFAGCMVRNRTALNRSSKARTRIFAG